MKRIYHGWSIVGYAVTCQMLLLGATQSAFGLYVLPVSKEFGLSRANMNTAIILMNVGTALVAPLVGWMADRFAPRPMLLIGSLLLGLTFATLGLSHSVWLSGIVIALVLTSGEAATNRPAVVLIARWFEINRARALTLGAFGLSLAGILVAPAVGILIGKFGWRSALMISGAVATAVAFLPALVLRLRPTAEEAAREGMVAASIESSAEAEQPGPLPLSVGGVLRLPLFWCIAVAIAVPMSVAQAVVISVAPLVVAAGMPVAKAALFVAVAGIASITAKMGIAIVADRINQMVLLSAVFCIGALENLTLYAVAAHLTYPVMLICAVMQGLSSSLLMPLLAALVARRFGPRSLGTVLGLMYPLIALSSALFARFAGEVYDHTGNYRQAFATFVAAELMAAVLMFSAQRLRSPIVVAATSPGPPASAVA